MMNSVITKIFSILIVFLSFQINIFSQKIISNKSMVSYENDSVILHSQTDGGTIQWQVSDDKITWTDLPGENDEFLSLHIDSSAYFRAKIDKNDCPFFSDTILVAEIFDERTSQHYDAVKIGSYTWMAENLDFYTPSGSWYYADDSLTHSKFGRLYNWETAQTVCPSGWHLPSDDEWMDLEEAIGISTSNDDFGWNGTNQAYKLFKDGSTGFNVQFGGQRYGDGFYTDVNVIGTYWSSNLYLSEEAIYRGFNIANGGIHRYNYSKDSGFSVRCIKD